MLVDDHAVVRAGIRQVFATCEDIVVDCEAADGQEALTLLRQRHVDAVLLDLSMPGRSGIEVLRRMRAEQPALPILILSMHGEKQYAISALKAGASGYLSKENAPEEIIAATRTVLAGRKYVSEALANDIATALFSDGAERAPHDRLSSREFDVFCQLAAGKSVSSIATGLFLSVKTVSTHRARILEKMELKTNSDLTYYAITHALIE